MARPIEEFTMAWKALSGTSEQEGWRSISVASAGACLLMAGRHFPGNEESLLAGFPATKLSAAERLPEGRGFEVVRADPHGDGKTWIGLTRKESGSPEIFAEMVGDVTGALDSASGEGEDRLLRVLLSRVRAWQEFMRKGAQVLSPEAEIGLLGELTFLGAAIKAGIPAASVVESWVGPLDGIQDFELGIGAVEVKATLANKGFLAKIGSLDQLDDSVRKPLFVAGVRVKQSESGKTLPEIAHELSKSLDSDPEALRKFSDRVFAAGLHDSHAERYIRRFVIDEMKIVEVGEGFPRLVLGSVHAGIRRAIYEIDLDSVSGQMVGLSEVLKKLGVL